MGYYNADMSAAPKDHRLLLVIPTGDAETPLDIEIGYWDAEEQRWTGEWRHTFEDTAYTKPTAQSQMDPIAWAGVPPINADLYPTSAAA